MPLYENEYDLGAYGTGASHGYDYGQMSASTYGSAANNLLCYYLGQVRNGVYYYYNPISINLNGRTYIVAGIEPD